jgi:NAD(P)-dependent dehydrogenase (short-subunit alcohol dehydrogenase family)
LDTLFDVNFRTSFLLTQRLYEPMAKQGSGSICNLASIQGLQGAPEHSAYAATKGAIIACTRALAVELGYRGIRVNAVAPGWINVEAHATAIPGFNREQAAEDAQNKVPVARYGIPLDIAKNGRLSMFLRRLVHYRADHNRRRRNYLAHVADIRFSNRVYESLRSGLFAEPVTCAGFRCRACITK